MIAAVSLQLFAALSHPGHAALIARVLAIPPGIPCPRQRDDIAGPSYARRPRDARHLPGHRGHDGGGMALAWIRMCKAITRHHPACCPYSTSPAESSLPQAPADMGLTRFHAR